MNQAACNNTNPCPCPAVKCQHHGRCCICIVKHKAAGNVPYCLRAVVETIVKRKIMQQNEYK